MVYDDAEKLYAEVHKDGKALIEEAFKAIFPPSVSLADPAFKTKKTGTIVGFNTTFFPRRDIVEVSLTGAASRLKSQVVQASKSGSTGLALLDCAAGGGVAYSTGMYADCKPVSGALELLYGSSVITLADRTIVARVGVNTFVLKNSGIQLTIADGRITSLYDVGQEYVPSTVIQ